MSEIDLDAGSLRGLADRIEASLDAGQPEAWAPAFAAADGKVKQEATETIEEGEVEVAAAGSAATEAGEAVVHAGGLAALVKGWLGRA
jgi:hypothetical protein